MILDKPILCFLLMASCAISVFGISKISYANTDGYYWRDFRGTIPDDALPGGEDEEGRTTYIGLALYARSDGEATPVPGQIRQKENKVFYEWGREEHVEERNLKILCTANPQRFEWIRTNTDKIVNTEKMLVLGALEHEFEVFIGRVYVEGQLSVGKVLVGPLKYKDLEGLHTTVNGKSKQFVHYDVLAYTVYPNEIVE